MQACDHHYNYHDRDPRAHDCSVAALSLRDFYVADVERSAV
jgi:hypothetical protein